MLDRDHGYTPTPVISHAILSYNQGREVGHADGVVITTLTQPSNRWRLQIQSSAWGPANTDATTWIADRANELLAENNDEVDSMYYPDALAAETTVAYDYITPYVEDLKNVIDMEAIVEADLSICADAMGGAGGAYWHAIRDTYGLNLDIRNDTPDPTFAFMHRDHDGKTRMDCSSPFAMAGLIELKDHYDIAFGNDPDFLIGMESLLPPAVCSIPTTT